MPYYRWRGVELTGIIRKGRLFAQSPAHLDELLLKREIALLSSTPVKEWFSRPIRTIDRAQLFSQLATLIDAGVLIPDALLIVANQVSNTRLQEIMHEIAQLVLQGLSLSQALERYPQVANPIMIQLIRAGEESGDMSSTLTALCTHLMATVDFYKRLRAALILPAITLLFFTGVLLVIFIGIMPRFIDVFASMGKEIPPLTQTMLSISNGLQSPLIGLIVSIFALIGILAWRLRNYRKIRRWLDRALIHTPLIGDILQQRFLAYSIQAVAVLCQGGMPLKEALDIVGVSIKNHVFKAQIRALERDVENGAPLSSAMARSHEGIFTPDVVAMVEVAEASGRLPLLLNRIALTYYDRVTQRLAFITLVLQPLIMLILGLLVAFLIFAVYGPIFTMSSGF